MESNREFKGVWIPKSLWLSKELSPIEKFFLLEIDSLEKSSECFASNSHFANLFDLSNGRCSQIIKKLSDEGYVSINYFYKKNSKEIQKRVVELTDTGFDLISGVVRNLKGGINKTKGGYLENDKDNNTIINNTNINNSIVENSTNLSTTPPKKKKEKDLNWREFEPELKEIYGYLNSKFGKESYKHSSDHNIYAVSRLKEGRTIPEFKKIIDSKYAEWINDEKMCKFIRPSTLFSTKHFSEYFETPDIQPSSNPTNTQTLAVDPEARAKADAILAEQNYHRDKISNYQIENNLFQSAKTGTVYEAIFINPNQQEVLLLALDSKEVISLSAEELKKLKYTGKVNMIDKKTMQELLHKNTDFNYHDTHKEFLSQKV